MLTFFSIKGPSKNVKRQYCDCEKNYFLFMMLIFCTVVQLGSQLRIENKNKNNFMKKRQLLGFVKMCVFTFALGKWRWFLKYTQLIRFTYICI